MPRRLPHSLSILLSLGIVLAMAVSLVPVGETLQERPQEAERKAAQSEAIAPAAIAVVRLPPPPKSAAPTPAPRAITPLTPKPTAVPLQTAKPRSFLKPAEDAARTDAAQKPEANTALAAAAIAPDAAAAMEGRTLLRLLEHGSGPAIEIAWPASAAAREQLYRRFRTCYGLRVAVLDGAERLFVADGVPGAPWLLNLDAFSGFMRQGQGSAGPDEAAVLRRIRARHGLARAGAPVRIFPRHVDAALLGGLQQIVGAAYAERKAIRARYALQGSRVLVEDVRADGSALPGRVDLSPAAQPACRTGGRA